MAPWDVVSLRIICTCDTHGCWGAHHEAKNAQNFEWKVNGKAQFSKIPP